ncbi:hypothetical protein ATCC90586_007660 [Pythium insidiosum]|nr:hypothetical protein ATCC90586_007660 [Pythium insidiosum]
MEFLVPQRHVETATSMSVTSDAHADVVVWWNDMGDLFYSDPSCGPIGALQELGEDRAEQTSVTLHALKVFLVDHCHLQFWRQFDRRGNGRIILEDILDAYARVLRVEPRDRPRPRKSRRQQGAVTSHVPPDVDSFMTSEALRKLYDTRSKIAPPAQRRHHVRADIEQTEASALRRVANLRLAQIRQLPVTQLLSAATSMADAVMRATSADDSGMERARPAQETPPVLQLTRQLIQTYNAINTNYYKKRNLTQDGLFPRKKKGVAKDDKGSDDYQLEQDEEVFNRRYKVRSKKLGTGSFGQVMEAYDMHTGEEVAIKIVKKKKNFTSQAQTEISILEGLHATDHTARRFIVQLKDSFVHKGHQCLVFERLDSNLYELLRKTAFNGISLKLLRKLTRQILQAMEYLAHPSVNVIHCDLKPENILLVHPTRSQLKIIDFGSSCLSHKQLYQYIQSRFYRSPEVLLGIKYTTAIDMWSLACIMVEMHTGKPLFGGSDQHDQLRRIANVLGMPPRELIERANPTFRREYFDEIVVADGENRLIDYRLKLHKSPASSRLGGGDSDAPTTLADIIGVESGGPGGRRLNKPDHTVQDYQLFLDLIQRMLDYNPATRITPAEALSHPFITAYRQSETREKKSKLVRSDQLRDVYSTDYETSHSMFVESNMERVKQRRLYENLDAGH